MMQLNLVHTEEVFFYRNDVDQKESTIKK